MSDPEETPGKVSLRQVIGSVIASFLGVQRSDNYERDASKGRPSQYIIVGLIFTILLIMFVIGLVKFVMYLAGV
ncbi:MAG: hypothetical protein BMS9Abin26_2160 [Gammaproteobacteria bacterium]|nr:MAG: hypothetical protein BMS9Abin26_2160 [Gammaproteobacteria bacterium]